MLSGKLIFDSCVFKNHKTDPCTEGKFVVRHRSAEETLTRMLISATVFIVLSFAVLAALKGSGLLD